MSAPVLMVQGTASGVGKSLLTAALCRIFVRMGRRVAPFKAQNMSNNASVTVASGEIARAQALQARAARVEPDVRMNPVLLKPLNDRLSDVVLLGQSRIELRDYPWHERKAVLWPAVDEALHSLRTEYDLIVAEGAGSPAETNLRHSDIVNMEVARHCNASVLLVADIDRGGAFASLFGTWALLDDCDRAHIRGFLLNRFRGDPSLLHPAPRDLEQRTGVPVVGCVPYHRHLLPEEDGCGIANRAGGHVRIAVIRLPYIANFDDFDPLLAEPDAEVLWVHRSEELAGAAAILIPGTRNTIADLQWLWRSGLADAIRAASARAVPVIGICGGYQMLGELVSDPHDIEAGGDCAGLGLLQCSTRLEPVKQTRQLHSLQATLPFPPYSATRLDGYAIHHGRTVLGPTLETWVQEDAHALGARNGTVWGTYLHGLFDNDELRRAWLASLGVAPTEITWNDHIESELDRLADVVAASIDVRRISSWVSA
jgi:adenosylcobyric acid synthase